MLVAPHRTAKELVIFWSNQYKLYYGIPYIPVWAQDAQRMKKIMDSYPIRDIKKLINFVFESKHKICEYLKTNGHPLPLFISSINSIAAIALVEPNSSNKQKHFTNYELDLRTPYWNDARTSYLWKLIQRQDLPEMILVIDDHEIWDLLLEKIRLQEKEEVPKLIIAMRNAWANKKPLRTAIKL